MQRVCGKRIEGTLKITVECYNVVQEGNAQREKENHDQQVIILSMPGTELLFPTLMFIPLVQILDLFLKFLVIHNTYVFKMCVCVQ